MDILEKYGIRKAEKRKTSIKLLMSGEAGSGKTLSALIIATGINEWYKKHLKRNIKVLVIDTEGGSSQVYANRKDIVEFDCFDFTQTFRNHGLHNPKNYVDLLRDIAESNQYDLVIIDSISHEWIGSGGVLEIVAEATKNSKNQTMSAWNMVTKIHNKFVDSLVQLPCHVICLARSKYDINQNLKIEQRKTFEFECSAHFQLVYDVQSGTNYAVRQKDRTGLFEQQFVIDKKLGYELIKWHQSGAEPIEVVEFVPEVELSQDYQIISSFIKENNASYEQVVKQFPSEVLGRLSEHENNLLNQLIGA